MSRVDAWMPNLCKAVFPSTSSQGPGLLILLLEAPSSTVYLGIGREGAPSVNLFKNSPELITFNG